MNDFVGIYQAIVNREKNMSLSERTAEELRQEVLSFGLDPEGKSTDEMKTMLAMVKWAKAHPDEPFPEQFEPMLARDSSKESAEWFKTTIKDTDWWIQEKFNGMRSILIMDNGKVRMTSRVKSVEHNMFQEHQDKVPHFKGMKIPFKGKTVLDGELTSTTDNIDTGATVSSSKLQAVVAIVHSETSKAIALQKKYGPLLYNAFDILFYDGEDVRNKPYDERVAYLTKSVAAIKEANPELPIQEAPVIKQYASPEDIFKQHTGKGAEGVMLKRRKGPYTAGRTKDLLKMKRSVTVDGWVSGAAKGMGKQFEKGLIGGFEISSNVDGKPRVIASVSGITDAVRKDATVLVDGKPTLNPKYLNKVYELIGQEWTKNGLLVHARIVLERPDKNPEDCYINSEDMKLDAASPEEESVEEGMDNETRLRVNQLGMELMNLSDQGHNPSRQAELKAEIERIRNESKDTGVLLKKGIGKIPAGVRVKILRYNVDATGEIEVTVAPVDDLSNKVDIKVDKQSELEDLW